MATRRHAASDRLADDTLEALQAEEASPQRNLERSVVQIRNSFIHVQEEEPQGRLPRFSMPAKLSHLKTASAPEASQMSDTPCSRKDDSMSVSSRCSTTVPPMVCRSHQRQSSSATVVTIDEMESEGEASGSEATSRGLSGGRGGLDDLRAACSRAAQAVAEESGSELPARGFSAGRGSFDDLRAACARAAQAVDEEERSRSSLGTVERVSDASVQTSQTDRQERAMYLEEQDARMSDPWALADLRREALASEAKSARPSAESTRPGSEGAFDRNLLGHIAWQQAVMQQQLPFGMPWAHPALQPSLFPSPHGGEDVAVMAAVHAGFSAGAAAAVQNMGQAMALAAVAKQQMQMQQSQRLASVPAPVEPARSMPSTAKPEPSLPQKRAKKAKPPPPCKWFARGTCKFGETCRFPHTGCSEELAQAAEDVTSEERPCTPEEQFLASEVLQPLSGPRESDTSLVSSQDEGDNKFCQVVWCDQRAFKETPESLAMKANLEARTGIAVKSHKTAEKCIRLLQKKQNWKEKPQSAQPMRVFLVSWVNAPVLVPYLSQSFGSNSKVVVLCDQCRSKGLESANGWAGQFSIVAKIASTWDEAVEAMAETVRMTLSQ